MGQIDGASIRKGMVLNYEGDAHLVVDKEMARKAQRRAYYQVTMRNLRTGQQVQKRFDSDETCETAEVDTRAVQYLYRDGEHYCFMDAEDYHTHEVGKDVVGDAAVYLTENLELKMLVHEGRAISFELPTAVALRVTEAAPWLKGDSVSNTTKPVTLETGLVLQVPLFVNRGDLVKVDTRTGEYMGRA